MAIQLELRNKYNISSSSASVFLFILFFFFNSICFAHFYLLFEINRESKSNKNEQIAVKSKGMLSYTETIFYNMYLRMEAKNI